MRGTCLTLGAAMIGAAAMMFLGGAAAQAAPQGASQGDHQLSIGVVNTSRVLRNMQEAKKLDADFRAQQGNLQQQQRQRETEIIDTEKHRDSTFKPGSDQYNEATTDIDRKRVELEVWKSMSNVQLERTYKQGLKGMYDHISAAAAQVAQQQHLDLVIADQSSEIGPDLDKAPIQQLEAALSTRAVLFANKKADITEDVLTVVERNFAQQAPPVGPGPGPGPVPPVNK